MIAERLGATAMAAVVALAGCAARTPPPGRTDASAAGEADCTIRVVSNAGRYTVCAVPDRNPIPLNEPFGMTVSIFERAAPSRLATSVILDVDAAMPEHHHGMNLKPWIHAWDAPPTIDVPPGHGVPGNGRYDVRGMLFHMPGRWEIHFDIGHGAITERAQAEVVLD